MLRDINRALSSAMDAVSDKLDESLARSRITVIGQVDVQGVIKHLFSPVAVHPGIRQTHLAWNRDCDKALAEFESASLQKQIFLLLTYILANDNVQTLKPTLTTIRHKQCLRR